jgi:hypothetical protein
MTSPVIEDGDAYLRGPICGQWQTAVIRAHFAGLRHPTASIVSSTSRDEHFRPGRIVAIEG